MEVKIMQVFYGNDYLPYKDKDRIIHYPVVGGAFLGASDTTKIKFYIGEIGGANTSWLAIGKLANGKTIEKILTTYTDENGNYALLELSSAWTQAKGDLLITLAGVEGTATMEYDEDTGLYTLDGNPVVGMTGSIKLSINYATPIIDYSIDEDTLTDLLPLISQKLNTSKGIYVLDIAEAVDVSMQVEGQLFYRKGNNSVLQWHNNSLVELFKVAGIYDNSNFNPSTEILSDVNGYNNGKPMLFNNGTSGFYLLNVGYDNVNQYTLTYVQFGENNGYGYRTGFVGTETINQALTTMNNNCDIKTFANVEQFATINGQKITEGGDIAVGGGSSNGYVDSSFVVSGDNAQIQFEKGDGSIDPLSLPLADGDNAGLMSPSDVNAITNLNNDVAALKQQTIRLLYTTKSNPTSAEILAFVEASGYTDVSKYTSIAVIVKDTNHVWKFVNDASISGEWVFNDELVFDYQDSDGELISFTSNNTNYIRMVVNDALYYDYQSGGVDFTDTAYEQGAWTDNAYKTIEFGSDVNISNNLLNWILANTTTQGTYSYGYFQDFGLDTVGQFTNDTMGAIKGSNADGKVYAESDGTGSVKGWNKVVNNFAPPYDNTATYAVGDTVTHNTNLYKCNTAISTPEDFDVSHWTATNVDSELSAVKNLVPTIRMTSTEFNALSSAEQTQVIRNGVIIKGTIGGVLDPTFTATDDTYTTGFVMGKVSGILKLGMYKGNHTNIKWFLESYSLQNPSLLNINALNGKGIPAYPSSTTKTYFLKYLNGLSWQEVLFGESATNSTTTLTYKTINQISISADTTYSLETAQTGCIPEYKALITNSDNANAITITLPSGTVIKAESGITVSSNTFTIPADSSIEMSLQDDLCLVILRS